MQRLSEGDMDPSTLAGHGGARHGTQTDSVISRAIDPADAAQPEGDPRVARRLALLRVAGLLGVAVLSGCASGRRSRGETIGQAEPLPDDVVLARPMHGTIATRPSRLSEQLPPPSPPPSGPRVVVPRASWTDQAPILSKADPMGPISRITIHHDGMNPFYSLAQADAAARLESIRRAHLQRGWADIGYHFSIDPAGRVYQCRPLNLQGAHVANQNPGNIGVMVMGNFEQQVPTPAAINTLEAFVPTLMRQYGVRVGSVFTHRELAATACPGQSLQARMVQARSRGGTIALA
ncbi:MAG: N-acetylmuramoyl-L-alanine amidase [Phycisphaerales bacterium]|nr:N-acetylmuramoyl-L-alanine amidase [Phycisphaerales bacterium]